MTLKVMTLQDMHEAVAKHQSGKGLPHTKLSLWRTIKGDWRAAWSGATMAAGPTADFAIKMAFENALGIGP